MCDYLFYVNVCLGTCVSVYMWLSKCALGFMCKNFQVPQWVYVTCKCICECIQMRVCVCYIFSINVLMHACGEYLYTYLGYNYNKIWVAKG